MQIQAHGGLDISIYLYIYIYIYDERAGGGRGLNGAPNNNTIQYRLQVSQPDNVFLNTGLDVGAGRESS